MNKDILIAGLDVNDYKSGRSLYVYNPESGSIVKTNVRIHVQLFDMHVCGRTQELYILPYNGDYISICNIYDATEIRTIRIGCPLQAIAVTCNDLIIAREKEHLSVWTNTGDRIYREALGRGVVRSDTVVALLDESVAVFHTDLQDAITFAKVVSFWR